MKKKKFMVALAVIGVIGLAGVTYAESEPTEEVVANVGQQLEQKSKAKDKDYIYKICEKVGGIINLKPAN